MDLLKKNNLSHVPVVCGGTIPKQHADALIRNGVAKIFPPQSTSESIVEYIVSTVTKTNGPAV